MEFVVSAAQIVCIRGAIVENVNHLFTLTSEADYTRSGSV
jgi:hypothetical protein